MSRFARADVFAATAPYLSWMALMFVFGASSAGGYALRTGVSLFFLLVSWNYFSRKERLEERSGGQIARGVFSRALIGVFWGAAVALLWIAPEYSSLYRQWCIIGDVPSPSDVQTSPFDPAVCGYPMAFVRLFGSAFVIAPAEELFFRSFLYRRLQSDNWRSVDARRFDLSAFLWMVGLFALEHNRIVAALAAGAVYGVVYMRSGLLSAVIAHVVTNLLLALYVLMTRAWAFW